MEDNTSTTLQSSTGTINLQQLTLPCQLLSASNCAYHIENKTGVYPKPFSNQNSAKAIGWNENTPTVVVGGIDNVNAALVGVVQNLNVQGKPTPSIVIAFQGTLAANNVRGIIDWMTDFFAKPIPFPLAKEGAMVHEGLYYSVNSILPQLKQAIQDLKQKHGGSSLPIYITGHSKGGGMATICAAMLAADYNIKGVYTFASPMIGNAGFVANFPTQIPVIRFENYLDIIPFCAPSEAFVRSLLIAALNYPEFADDLKVFIDIIQLSGDKNGAWGYVPLGQLHYIKKNGTIEIISYPPYAPNESALEIAYTLASGESGFKRVAAAHAHGCSSLVNTVFVPGYQNSVCKNSGLCK